MDESSIREMVSGKRVAVLGYGISNRPLVRLLGSYGARIEVYDEKSPDELGPEARENIRNGVRFSAWKPENEQLLSGVDYVFRTPGIRPDCAAISSAVRNGSVLTSEMELFFDLTPATVIGITGSDGKTTTTNLTRRILESALERRGLPGRVYMGGNCGVPLLPFVTEMTRDDFAVVELSSFQLMTMRRSPNRAVLTNVTPNHLNWHRDMNEYIQAKSQIMRHRPVSRVVLNADNAVTLTLGKNTDIPVTYVSLRRSGWHRIVPEWQDRASAVYVKDGWICRSAPHSTEERILDTADILLPGAHNTENYMFAIAVLDGLAGPEDVRNVAVSFAGVEHRLEIVREWNGIRFINSSIDSTPSRTLVSLQAVGGHPVVILGGRDKHLDYDELAARLYRQAKGVVLTGEAAGLIREALDRCPGKTDVPVRTEPVFADAVRAAVSMAGPGDTVLLSPACTSFDAFANFEERGRTFKTLINEL